MVYDLIYVFDWFVIIFIILGLFLFFLFLYGCILGINSKNKDEPNAVSLLIILMILFMSVISFLISGWGMSFNVEMLNNNPNYYCPQHPEDSKCILVNESCPENYYFNPNYPTPNNASECWLDINNNNKYHLNSLLSKKETIKNYRFKNDCEINPREDADCVCDRYVMDFIVRNTTKLFQCESGNMATGVPANQIIVAVEYKPSEYIDFILRRCDEISKNKLCSQSHIRTPVERCEYFNLSAVLNDIKVMWCVPR